MSEMISRSGQKKEAVLKKYLRYTSLNVAGMIGMSAYILADTFFIARGIGADALAALNFSLVLYTFMNATGILLGMGSATKFQIHKAFGEEEKANQTFTSVSIAALGVAMLFLVVVEVFAEPLSAFLGADQATAAYTQEYSRTTFFFAPFFVFNNVLLAFVRNDGRPQLAMIAMLVGSFANIGMDYLFIFEFGWGMFGAALATGTAPIISIAVLAVHFVQRKNTFHLVKPVSVLTNIKGLLVLGFSSFIVEISGSIILFFLNWIMLGLEGNVGVAAYGIVANIAFVAVALFVGVGQGVQPLTSKYHAHHNNDYLKKIVRYIFVTCLVMAVVIYAVILLWAEPIAMAFNKDLDLYLNELAVRGLRIYFLGFFFAGFNIVFAAFFSSVELPSRGLLITILRGFVFIFIFAALLPMFFGIDGVWMAFPLGELATFVVTLVSLIFFLRKSV